MVILRIQATQKCAVEKDRVFNKKRDTHAYAIGSVCCNEAHVVPN